MFSATLNKIIFELRNEPRKITIAAVNLNYDQFNLPIYARLITVL